MFSSARSRETCASIPRSMLFFFFFFFFFMKRLIRTLADASSQPLNLVTKG